MYSVNINDDNYIVASENSKELVGKEEYKEEGGHNVCKAIQDLMEDSRLEERKVIAKKLFANGVSYELVRASVEDITDEELKEIYKEVCA